jgi:hypothetical protein
MDRRTTMQADSRELDRAADGLFELQIARDRVAPIL